jgi:hypothetical protein
MVEFALVGPLFLLFVFGIMEGALFVNARITLDNAAREGARIAALCGDAPSYTYNGLSSDSLACLGAGTQAVKTHLGILEPTAVSITIACEEPDMTKGCPLGTSYTPSGSTVHVQLTYSYAYFSMFGSGGPTIPMTADAREISQQ